MMTGRGEATPPAGGPARHVPVLLQEVLEGLRPRDGGLYVDGTFGAGGYSRAILATPGARVVAFDRDPSAIRDGAELVAASGGRLTLVQARFGDLASELRALGIQKVDGVALDIGVSSMQFDQAARGFSFRFDGPLDMRMESAGRSAADIVNEESEERLADIIYNYGEDRASRRIARFIVNARKNSPIATTAALADIVQRAIPGKPGDIHPATRTFQGLRIFVNDELGELVAALAAAHVAGIDPVLGQRLGTVRELGQQFVAVIVKVAHQGDRHVHAVQGVAQGGDLRGSLGGVDGDADQFGTGPPELAHLQRGGLGVGGIGIGHGLHHDRRVATHPDHMPAPPHGNAAGRPPGRGARLGIHGIGSH